MNFDLSLDEIQDAGVDATTAESIFNRLDDLPLQHPVVTWRTITDSILTPQHPFELHRLLHDTVFAGWDAAADGPVPVWVPPKEVSAKSNVRAFGVSLGEPGVGVDARGRLAVSTLHRWSVDNCEVFWERIIDTLGVVFKAPPSRTADLSAGVENPVWLPGASLNIADSCFRAPGNQTAVIYQSEGGTIQSMSYDQLDAYSNRVANSLAAIGLGPGDAIAIAMPMTVEAVAAYLGIVKLGAVVVSIADSFAPEEIATRLRIAGADTVITQDVMLRAGKTLPMYQKVVDAGAARAVVIRAGDVMEVDLRDGDVVWNAFLADADTFESHGCAPDATANVLFSSGTTGDPKAIPWSHTTPIKCAMDGYLHHDIQPGHVVAWPTNLGWMMGPWLIFATMMNRGTMALYYGAPNTDEFCEFVEKAGVNMLGVVPSLVKAWRAAGRLDGRDWTKIHAFSSTGEASNADDMFWLMAQAGYRPMIEYCGGTEIGGGYISGTVIQAQCAATFSTPAFGLQFYLLDDNGRPARNGELFLAPPSIGLSLKLLNRDHHEVYYDGTPAGPNGELLRRHGDQMEAIGAGYVRAQGRADDTMNLGGIKISSAEIERAVNALDGVLESAAIAIEPPGGGPSQLVIYAVLDAAVADGPTADDLKPAMQKEISTHLNPLFRVHEVVVIDALPRTASNKVMRRVLRSQYT